MIDCSYKECCIGSGPWRCVQLNAACNMRSIISKATSGLVAVSAGDGQDLSSLTVFLTDPTLEWMCPY